MKQLVLDLIPAPAPTLANFVPGRNGEALAALRTVLDGNADLRASPVIYLWGVTGSGKTHLVQACLGQGFAVLPESENSIADANGHHAIDDVNTLNDVSQHALFDLINRQQMAAGVLIATGNCAPRDLPLRRDLASRLGSCLVFQLQPLSDHEKAEALQAHARTRSFALREEVVAYLLRHGRRDLASLIHVLDQLDRYSLETGREITLPLLKEMAQPSLYETT